MAASRVIIAGVAVTAAIGAGYVAKNMASSPPTEIVVPGPKQPTIALSEVLVLASDVPMGQPLGNQIKWESWPADSIADGFITKQAEPDAIDKLKDSLARVSLYAGEPLR